MVVGVERGQIHRGAFSRWVPFLRWYFYLFIYFLQELGKVGSLFSIWSYLVEKDL